MSAPSRAEEYDEALDRLHDNPNDQLDEMLGMLDAVSGKLEDWETEGVDDKADPEFLKLIRKALEHLAEVQDIVPQLKS